MKRPLNYHVEQLRDDQWHKASRKFSIQINCIHRAADLYRQSGLPTRIMTTELTRVWHRTPERRQRVA